MSEEIIKVGDFVYPCPLDKLSTLVEQFDATLDYEDSAKDILGGSSCWCDTGCCALWNESEVVPTHCGSCILCTNYGDRRADRVKAFLQFAEEHGYDMRMARKKLGLPRETNKEHEESMMTKKLKKLTAQVFGYVNCPQEAKCAVVDEKGFAFWCVTDKIEPFYDHWSLTVDGSREVGVRDITVNPVWVKIGEGFDATDWRNSTILRKPQEKKPTPPEQDVVNHPDHYCVNGLECFEVMRQIFGDEAVKTFCRLNAFKYLWRSQHKNGDQDIAKAAWYTKKYGELGGDVQ